MNVLTLLACRPLNLDVVVSERIDPRRQPIGRAWGWLRRRVYPSARALVVQTERVRRQMAPLMRGRPTYVVPNAVWSPETESRPLQTGSNHARTIVAMGRLSGQKGFDLLIDAFAQIAPRHPDWSLRIVGEGPQRGNLEKQVKACDLEGRISLTGWEPQPAAALATAGLFVLSSRFEGFPNALLEAMACGLPVVSFDCETGPAEIIRDGVDGVLVPPEDVDRLAGTIDRLIGDESLRRRLGQAATHVIERFSVERYFGLWEAILTKAPPPLSEFKD
jgi:GalNAc-alpha-(1->4)-GalNAc-alpha-(1->3)-diNAcBac-PP-undecaprenol alpha-1,4-N-acetyl-D-galactosaminyltransferase